MDEDDQSVERDVGDDDTLQDEAEERASRARVEAEHDVGDTVKGTTEKSVESDETRSPDAPPQPDGYAEAAEENSRKGKGYRGKGKSYGGKGKHRDYGDDDNRDAGDDRSQQGGKDDKSIDDAKRDLAKRQNVVQENDRAKYMLSQAIVSPLQQGLGAENVAMSLGVILGSVLFTALCAAGHPIQTHEKHQALREARHEEREARREARNQWRTKEKGERDAIDAKHDAHSGVDAERAAFDRGDINADDVGTLMNTKFFTDLCPDGNSDVLTGLKEYADAACKHVRDGFASERMDWSRASVADKDAVFATYTTGIKSESELGQMAILALQADNWRPRSTFDSLVEQYGHTGVMDDGTVNAIPVSRKAFADCAVVEMARLKECMSMTPEELDEHGIVFLQEDRDFANNLETGWNDQSWDNCVSSLFDSSSAPVSTDEVARDAEVTGPADEGGQDAKATEPANETAADSAPGKESVAEVTGAGSSEETEPSAGDVTVAKDTGKRTRSDAGLDVPDGTPSDILDDDGAEYA